MSRRRRKIVRLSGWRARINRARKRGTFTPRDKAEANGWGTCAVGEAGRRSPSRFGLDLRLLRDGYKRAVDGGPVQGDMRDAGLSLFRAVRDNEYDRARRAVLAIETGTAIPEADLDGWERGAQ